MAADYDALGATYAEHRQQDPRIAVAIDAALGDARTVVNVGAGTGSYEPEARAVVAVEPSAVMVAQRSASGARAPAVRATAEALPFGADRFDAALAVLTSHHWSDAPAGLREMRRVAPPRQVVLTWDPEVSARFWLVADYLPAIAAFERGLSTLDVVVACLPDARVTIVPVAHDCVDGFFGAYWQRPAAYLDVRVRACISTFHRLAPPVVERAIGALREDLRSGAWHERYANLAGRDTLDVGYRLVVAGRG